MGKIQLLSEERSGSAQPQRRFDSRQVVPEVGSSMAAIRQEIDDVCADMRTFPQREPDEVMRLVSGWSARFVELKVRIRRIEDLHREWRAVREREVEPVLEQLQQQYVIASRLLSVRELDYRMSMGAP